MKYRKIIKYSSILFIILQLISFSCNKDDDELTEPTFPYFQMEVDGELWAPSGASFGGGAPFSVRYSEGSGFINVSAFSIAKEISNINLTANNLVPFEISEITEPINFIDKGLEEGCALFALDSLQSSFMVIEEIDVNARIIKVSFGFECINDCENRHRITKGIVHANYGT